MPLSFCTFCSATIMLHFTTNTIMLHFTTNPSFSDLDSRFFAQDRFGVNKPGHHPAGAAVAGAAATVFHDAIMTPMDVVKQRLQLGYHKGMLDCVMTIRRTEGSQVGVVPGFTFSCALLCLRACAWLACVVRVRSLVPLCFGLPALLGCVYAWEGTLLHAEYFTPCTSITLPGFLP